MGDPRSSQALGSIEIRWIAPRVLGWHVTGYIDMRVLDDSLNRALEMMASVEGPIATFVDLRAGDGFAAGTPIRGIRWVQSQPGRIVRAAYIVRSGPLAAVVRTFPVLLRGIDIAIVSNPDEALAFLGATGARGRIDEGRRRRKASGEQPVDSQHEPLLARRRTR
jgi:hypothetical protein